MRMKTLSEIAAGLITHIHDKLPEVDTKEGTFIRDVFIDPVSTEIADLYKELKLLELSQSIVTATGDDLDKLARNFFIRRKEATYASGKLRFYIGPNEPEFDIFIPKGAIVGSPGDLNKEPTDYMTTTSATIVAGDKGTYFRDTDVGMWYVDIDAISLEPGSIYNTEANTITLLGDLVGTEIHSVTNPLPFTGGTDAESDLSLQMRVSMAITGVNIGTKDGYKAFMMKQSEVRDAIIIGAEDRHLMKRDNGEGGMVDIYVRTDGGGAEEYVKVVKAGDFSENIQFKHRNERGEEEDRLPIISVDRVVGKIVDDNGEVIEKNYINGSNYKIERGSERYYRDIIWDLRSIDTNSLKGEELLRAEASNVINEMLQEVNLQNIRYNLNWQSINPYNDINNGLRFYRGYYSDGLVYMITTKNDTNNPFIGGRNFILSNNQIYERVYVKPDFIVKYDENIEYEAKSIESKDAIQWLPNGNMPEVNRGEDLYIYYTYDGVIRKLQDRLNEKRILTADVLIKKAIEIPIEIKMRIVPEPGYNTITIRNTIINNITNYINDMIGLGGAVDRSDLIYIARGVDGVDAVDISNIHLSILDSEPRLKIETAENEYMKLESIYIEILDVGESV